MRALRAFRVFIVGLKNLTVEVDAKYIKGMLNNPDIQPNATINRWIAAILTFDFKLVHVPAAKHTGADGLSRRRAAPEDGEEESDVEEWIDRAAGLMFEAVDDSETVFGATALGQSVLGLTGEAESLEPIPRAPEAEARDVRMDKILRYLMDGTRGETWEKMNGRQIAKMVGKYFERNGNLWQKRKGGR